MLTRVDAFLLAKIQKFCDRFQQTTGFTKFVPQKLLLLSAALLFGIGIILSGSLIWIAAYVGYFGLVVCGIIRTDNEEEEFLRTGKIYESGFAAPSRRLLQLCGFLVLSFLFSLFPVEDGNGFISFAFLLFSVWMYTCACVPRPPSKSKMREWYEKALTWLNDKLAPASAGAPVLNR